MNIVKESLDDILKPKSNEDIKSELSMLTFQQKFNLWNEYKLPIKYTPLVLNFYDKIRKIKGKNIKLRGPFLESKSPIETEIVYFEDGSSEFLAQVGHLFTDEYYDKLYGNDFSSEELSSMPY